jgi:hypothetical protein
LADDIGLCIGLADPFLKDVGRNLRAFLEAPAPATADALATGLRVAAVHQEQCAKRLENIAAEIGTHAMDERVDRRLAEQARKDLSEFV